MPATEENILIYSGGHAELLSPEDNENFGVPVINMVDGDDSIAIDLTNPKVTFSRIEFDKLHTCILKESQRTASFTVGLLYLEYSEGQETNLIKGHYMNYLILNGKLIYVDAQAGSMNDILDITPYSKNVYYKVFSLKKISLIADVKIKTEPGSSSSSFADIKIKTEPEPYASFDSASASSPSNVLLVQNNTTATGVLSLPITPKQSANDKELNAAVEILRNPSLSEHHKIVAEKIMPLLDQTSVTDHAKVYAATEILCKPSLGEHHKIVAEKVMPLLDKTSVSAEAKVYAATEILRKPSLSEHHKILVEKVMPLLDQTSVSARAKVYAADAILKKPSLSEHHKIVAEKVTTLLDKTYVSAEAKVWAGFMILKNPSLSEHHKILAGKVMPLLDQTSVTDHAKVWAATRILQNPSLSEHHADASKALLSLLHDKLLSAELKETCKTSLNKYMHKL